ncbi:hypothetical protein YERSI8AC_220062 [Enterobacterales bacterium 8AC]|nr:hypothetical protein YERSI8AC_220062 [Enterobacterales bacterium 8AC]
MKRDSGRFLMDDVQGGLNMQVYAQILTEIIRSNIEALSKHVSKV